MSDDVGNQPLSWHYTNDAGLRGILKDKKLWATDVRYLNDSHEYIHAIHRARADLAQRRPQVELDETFLRSFDQALTNYEEALTDRRGGHTAKAFVFSLSTRRDHLPQWRAYAPGVLGFSLGFNIDHLPYVDSSGIFECIYSDAEKKRIVSGFIDETHEHFRELTTPPPEHPYQQRSILRMPDRRLAEYFPPIAARMKHPGFEDENEWRVVLFEFPDGSAAREVVHRQGQAGPVPYVEIDLSGYSTWPIQEIMVAPSEDQDLAMEAARRAIRAAGLDFQGIRITASRIPLRSR
jgi:hypothetical protein